MGMQFKAGNSATATDRRETQRFSITAPVTLILDDSECPAYTRDLSSHGLYMYVPSSKVFQVGQDLDLLVKLPPDITLSSHCLIRCRGRVVRIEDAPDDLAGLAAEILQYSILSDAENGVYRELLAARRRGN